MKSNSIEEKQESLFSFWFNNSRYNALPQSLLPAITAIVVASKESSFCLCYSLLAILSVFFAHLSFNLFDDYFDYKKSDVNVRYSLHNRGVRARIGKCYYLTSGKTTLKRLALVASLLGLVALLIGLVFFFIWGNIILIYIFTLAFLGINYSGPPFRFSYHGLGEIVTGFVFGPLLMSGIYIASTGVISSNIWVLSIPIGFLVANIILTHDIIDFKADQEANKKTIAVIINNQKINFFLSCFFTYIPYIVILSGIIFYNISPLFLLVLLTLPQAITLSFLLFQFVKNPQKKFSPKWWMQPMEKWEFIVENDLDWFMIRWFLSRNILIFFVIFIIFAIFLS